MVPGAGTYEPKKIMGNDGPAKTFSAKIDYASHVKE